MDAPDALARLPAGLRPVVATYLGAVHAALTGDVRAVIVTGSAAQDDWCPGRSDLDVVVVTGAAGAGPHLAALTSTHRRVAAEQAVGIDAVYMPAAVLGQRPLRGAPARAVKINGVDDPLPSIPDPVLWAMIHRHGVAVRGPAPATICPEPEASWLREWNSTNLHQYWRPWAERARRHLRSLDRAAVQPAEGVAWGLLGPGRLHCTIQTGAVISKTAAADYTGGRFPAWAGLLERAKRWRAGDDGQAFSAADGLATCALIDAIVQDIGPEP